jgi:hypothetical protein
MTLQNEETNNNESEIVSHEVIMPRRRVSGYYKTKIEAEQNRRAGDRIYYDPRGGYYIRRPQKRSFWDFF